MKTAIPLLLTALMPFAAIAAPRHDLPSCDLKAQQALQAPAGGPLEDERQAHIAMRADALRADIDKARESGRLSQSEADAFVQRVGRIRSEAAAFVQEQGFLSAGERASYDRELDEIVRVTCS
ncbi:hypothetical protein [Pseudomonas sp. Marseille-QA0892]